jgi:hypothetical protein
VILYAGLVVAAPYLMWRLVASLNTRPHPTTTHQGDTLWQQGEGEHFIAKERVSVLPYPTSTKNSIEELISKRSTLVFFLPPTKLLRSYG